MTLRDLRERRKLTQTQAATELNVLQSSISQWESGECYPRMKKLTAIARLYQVQEQDIIEAISKAKLESAPRTQKKHP